MCGQYDNKLDVLWLAYGWLYSSIKRRMTQKTHECQLKRRLSKWMLHDRNQAKKNLCVQFIEKKVQEEENKKKLEEEKEYESIPGEEIEI